jgi:hypothetical protein
MEPSVRAARTQGARLGGSHHGLGNGGCCERGEPAGVLFDATARDDQHEYSDRSLRETGHGSCRAASGLTLIAKVRGAGGLRPHSIDGRKHPFAADVWELQRQPPELLGRGLRPFRSARPPDPLTIARSVRPARRSSSRNGAKRLVHGVQLGRCCRGRFFIARIRCLHATCRMPCMPMRCA